MKRYGLLSLLLLVESGLHRGQLVVLLLDLALQGLNLGLVLSKLALSLQLLVQQRRPALLTSHSFGEFEGSQSQPGAGGNAWRNRALLGHLFKTRNSVPVRTVARSIVATSESTSKSIATVRRHSLDHGSGSRLDNGDRWCRRRSGCRHHTRTASGLDASAADTPSTSSV
jgi:hypothetical protein